MDYESGVIEPVLPLFGLPTRDFSKGMEVSGPRIARIRDGYAICGQTFAPWFFPKFDLLVPPMLPTGNPLAEFDFNRNVPCAIRFAPARLAAVFVMGILGLGVLHSVGRAQQDTSSSADADLMVRNLTQIQKEYKEFLEKRDRIQDEYKQIEEMIQKTEKDFQRINNEGMRQQMAAMESMMQSMRVDMALSNLANTNDPSANNRNTPRRTNADALVQQQLLQDRMMLNMNTAMRGEELRQLDAASQATVRQRFQGFQDATRLQRERAVWQSEWPAFMDRYWKYSDPERRFTQLEIEKALEVLGECDKEDYAAKLTAALLMERMGRISEGISLVDEVLQAETALKSVALATKAVLLEAVDKPKEAKTAMQSAIKLHRTNPYVRWLHARDAARQEQWAVAESELKVLTTIKSLEVEAHRALALVHFSRSKKTASEGVKAKRSAQVALDLEAQPLWYSHLVMALAHHAMKKKDDALSSLEKAERKAAGENQEWCQELRTAIENGDPIDWAFDRRLAEVEK